MIKHIVFALVASLASLASLAGVAFAEKPAEPPVAAAPVPAAAPAAAAVATGQRSPAELHQICVDAMNADPVFRKDIEAMVDKEIDAKTVAAHDDADHHIQKNERHVVYAYAAMWVVAALFVAFLWMRQQALKREIAALRADLDAAAKEAK